MAEPAVVELGPAGHRYRIHDPGGGGRVAKALRSGVPYEATVLEDIRTLGLRGVAVDAGANLGNHTLWLAAVCGLAVVAFEPLKLPELHANIALNELQEQVTVHPVALGASDGTVTCVGKGRFKVAPGVRGAGPRSEHVGKTVPLRRLDSYQLDSVALLKIDVEGMEAEVIRGGMDTIRRNRPVIYAEAWDDTYQAATGALLEPLGYRMVHQYRWKQQRWEHPRAIAA